jgi:hypothetical protein
MTSTARSNYPAILKKIWLELKTTNRQHLKKKWSKEIS